MKEEFLHYVWKTGQFDSKELRSKEGEPIEIIYPGEHNHDSGPDFINAKIRIGEQLWAGNVEIHVRASDWIKHRHENDAAYDNVILHVVFHADANVLTSSGRMPSALELKERISRLQYVHYLRLHSSKEMIPCAKRLNEIPAIEMTAWLPRLLAERLERKANLLKTELENNRGDWEETFYRHLVRQFGMKVNADPFQWLAAAAPFRMLSRQRDNLLQTEALLFGQSGLLPEKQIDTYSTALIREYVHLQAKYSVRPMPARRWKFMRLRPNNFPTVRIAQLAFLLYRYPRLFSLCMETKNMDELRTLLDVPASGYWETHYRFGVRSNRRVKRLGEQAINSILINTVILFRFLMGKMKDDAEMQQDALEQLERMPAESNRITRKWEELGIIPASACESQALIELSGNYCAKKKCLHCAIGARLLRDSVKNAA